MSHQTKNSIPRHISVLKTDEPYKNHQHCLATEWRGKSEEVEKRRKTKRSASFIKYRGTKDGKKWQLYERNFFETTKLTIPSWKSSAVLCEVRVSFMNASIRSSRLSISFFTIFLSLFSFSKSLAFRKAYLCFYNFYKNKKKTETNM